MNRILSLILATFIVACTSQQPTSTPGEPVLGVIGDSAMVASAHPLASQVGADILRKGGNAFDAAIAVHFALAVVFPAAGNIGGGGFAVIRENDGTIAALDFREKAPKAATHDMYLDEDGNIIEGKSTIGRVACGVPGSVDGMFRIHERYASLPMHELLQPAINLADQGFLLTEREANFLNRFENEFREQNDWPMPVLKEEPWQEGDSIFYKDLALTLALIRDLGRNGFYGGIVADQIVKEVRKGGGIITMDDLASYQSKWRKPVTGNYRGHKVISMPPPSSGGIALLQLLQGTENYDLAKWGHNSAKSIHVMTELERRVYADRATYLGDPDFYEVPQEMLLSPDYNRERFSDIKVDLKTASTDIKEGNVEVIESVETTHFSVVDSEGNAVAITTTINGLFGNKVMVRGAGFFLNNEMDDFSSKPGAPNQFGLVGGEANKIEPEKRMLSTMTPTIIEKDGKLRMVVGTPGGSTIITSVYQTILNVIDHDMTMQEAVNAEKFHHQWLPDVVLVEENRFDDQVITALEDMGHEIRTRRTLGRMDCILVLPDGSYEGGSDATRGDNTSVGF